MEFDNTNIVKETPKKDATTPLHEELAQQFEPHARGGGGGGGHPGGGGGRPGGGGGGGRPGGGGHGGGDRPHPQPHPQPRPGGGGHGGGDRPHPQPHPQPRPHPGPDRPHPQPHPGPDRPHPQPHPGPDHGHPRPGPGPDHGHPHPGPGPDHGHPHPGPGPDHGHPHPGPDHGHGPGRDHGHRPPEHGFPHGRDHWGPPEHGHWGWHNEERWRLGFDVWFFQQDPNYRQWDAPIRNEAASIATQLDIGNAAGAADELSEDLYAMRGDMYAQDQLLSEVNRFDRKGLGADISLGNWDPVRGTWDNVQILAPGGGSIPINTYGYDDRW